MYILNAIEDQIGTLVWATITTGLFSVSSQILNFSFYASLLNDYVHPLSSNQPLTWLVVSVITSLLGLNGYNLLILLSTILNLFISYLFFKRYSYGWIYAVLFTFSGFYWAHLGIHMDLSQFWVFPLFFYLYFQVKERSSTYKGFVGLGLYVTFVSLISNYFGYFLFLSLGILCTFDLITESGNRVKTIKLYSLAIMTGALFNLLILFPFVNKTYINPPTSKERRESVIRDMQDFFTFTGRPWYHLIPSAKNPAYGRLAEQAVTILKSTNYYLADDYFANEHRDFFFGFGFYIVLGFLLYKGFKKGLLKNKDLLFWIYFVTFISILMLPPYITFGGVKLYMPSYILYKLFPIFRVLARMSLLVHLGLLSLAGVLFKRFNLELSKRVKYVLVGLLLFSIFETFSPIRIVHFTEPPIEIAYVAEVIRPSSKVGILPDNKFEEWLFWLGIHKTYLYRLETPEDLILSELDYVIYYPQIKEFELDGTKYEFLFRLNGAEVYKLRKGVYVLKD